MNASKNLKVGQEEESRLYRLAYGLAIFTIVFNLFEGMISTFFGFEEETLTLFGFGVDSFIETISGLGIAHMVLRIQKNPNSKRDQFEIRALQVTGIAFYLLVLGLSLTLVFNVMYGLQPSSTIPGVIISSISIGVMWLMIRAKVRLGDRLDSAPMIADAKCAQICMYMSFILLTSSALYVLFKVPYIDAIGTLGIIYLSYQEGKECFAKAKNQACACGH